MRLWWRDEGLDYDGGVLPGPFRFKLDAKLGEGDWFTLVDKTQSESDMLIDFLRFDSVTVDYVHLVITGWPKGITPALIDATLFGIRAAAME